MSEERAKQSLENLGQALERLAEALHEKEDNILYIDGTVQRFEFALELFWKTLKRLLQLEGIESRSPKESLIQAYSIRWIDNDRAWLQMLKDRNETSHMYNREMALRIYNNIREYYPELARVYDLLREKYHKS